MIYNINHTLETIPFRGGTSDSVTSNLAVLRYNQVPIRGETKVWKEIVQAAALMLEAWAILCVGILLSTFTTLMVKYEIPL